MNTTWKILGDNAKEKLDPYVKEWKLSYLGLGRKSGYMYDFYLETFEQYEALEELMISLELDLTISFGAEWLAVLYTDKYGLPKSV